jgi:hypothetical protein
MQYCMQSEAIVADAVHKSITGANTMYTIKIIGTDFTTLRTMQCDTLADCVRLTDGLSVWYSVECNGRYVAKSIGFDVWQDSRFKAAKRKLARQWLNKLTNEQQLDLLRYSR